MPPTLASLGRDIAPKVALALPLCPDLYDFVVVVPLKC